MIKASIYSEEEKNDTLTVLTLKIRVKMVVQFAVQVILVRNKLEQVNLTFQKNIGGGKNLRKKPRLQEISVKRK